ncbi:MAG TPA: dienelactone hydrolase family protein [Azospirillum sp.]|nr:dienelactone hydrolase family protein [Azospirillum sp.]
MIRYTGSHRGPAAATGHTRRVFLERSACLLGGIALGSAWVFDPAAGADADPALAAETVDYPGATGTMRAFVVRRGDVAKAPGVMVIHGDRGLTPFYEDLARRFAAAGFVAIVPDLLAPLGGTPKDPERARAMIDGLNLDDVAQNLLATMTYLAGNRFATGEIGAVGFGWGGGLAIRLASRAPALDAVVAFDPPPGTSPAGGTVSVPVLLHRKAADRALGEVPDTAGVPHETYVYEGAVFDGGIRRAPSGVGGGNSGGEAELAHSRTIAFLKKHLGT